MTPATLLLVEDDPAQRSLVSEVLTGAGFTVLAVDGVTAALEAIADATGGRSVNADDLGSLADAYREIGSVVGFEDVKKPITAQYAFFALGFAVIAALGAVMMAARWPR